MTAVFNAWTNGRSVNIQDEFLRANNLGDSTVIPAVDTAIDSM